MVKLIDVYPNGKGAFAMAEGIARAAATSAVVEIDLIGTGLVFLPGHCVRLLITTASFPQFAACEHSASNTVFHGSSSITLPVVPLPEDGRLA